ncbi:MAG: CarD family transcriptional regulator [Acidiferrobacter sp.]
MKKHVFVVGEAVFYPTAGVGAIEAEEDIFFGGERQQCYVIRIPYNRITIKVPKDKAVQNGLRPLLQGRKIKDLFRVLGERSGERPVGHWADHYKDLERRIQSGCCLEIGAVVRDLTRLKAGGGLSFEEARLLETASGYLSREVAAVEGIAPEIALDRIRMSIVGV